MYVYIYIVMDVEKTLFVFYTLNADHPNPREMSWQYTFPSVGLKGKTWYWVGSGSTAPMGRCKKTEYEREEQFAGPSVLRDITREYLNTVFRDLKSRGIITKYKVRATYAP